MSKKHMEHWGVTEEKKEYLHIHGININKKKVYLLLWKWRKLKISLSKMSSAKEDSFWRSYVLLPNTTENTWGRDIIIKRWL